MEALLMYYSLMLTPLYYRFFGDSVNVEEIVLLVITSWNPGKVLFS